MTDKQYIIRNPDRKPAVDLNNASKKPGISPASIADTVRSFIPSKKCKYDSHDKINELYREWSMSPKEQADSLSEKVLLHFYEFYKPRIMSIVKRYRSLSPIFDDDDLMQTALLGVLQALTKYDHGAHVTMKFSTYLEWSIRNIFQRTIGCSDKFVEIYNKNNDLLLSLSYQEFMSRKKAIESSGHTYFIRSRLCYFTDIVISGGPHAFTAIQDKVPLSASCDQVNTAIMIERDDDDLLNEAR